MENLTRRHLGNLDLLQKEIGEPGAVDYLTLKANAQSVLLVQLEAAKAALAVA